jgi:hypothetical protein
MRRRKLLVALVGLAVVVTVGVVVFLSEPPSQITRENFEHIHRGMTREEVDAILGPPGDHRTSRGENYSPVKAGPATWQADPDEYWPGLATWHDAPAPLGEHWVRAVWIGDKVSVEVLVDGTGRVVMARDTERRTTGNALDSLHWRTKHLWHRWFPE